jgi:hypothetical protein
MSEYVVTAEEAQTEEVQIEEKKRHHKNKRKVSAREAREMFMNRKKRMTMLDISLPDLEDLDEQLGILELTAKDIEEAQKLSKGDDGETDSLKMTTAMIVRALVLLETREQIFSRDDIGYMIENFGLSVIEPLGTKVALGSGVSVNAIEEAKKNLLMTTGSVSATS